MFLILVLMLMLPGVSPAEDNLGVVEHETGFYYTVKEGDTLWDLSRRFSDSPWLWPDMWKDNRHIANPHEIYPGDRIRLYRRKDVDHLTKEGARGAAGFGKGKTPGSYSFPGIDRIGFVRDAPIEPIGIILREHNRLQMIHAQSRVYVQANGDARLAPGGRYFVYRTMGEVMSPLTRASIGIQHLIVGVVEILQEEPLMYVGKITESFRRIQSGDLLTPYRKRAKSIPISRGPIGFSGIVVSPEEDVKLLAASHIAFIDKGEEDGVRPGQMFFAYAEEGTDARPKKDGKKELLAPPLKIGEMIVLHSERTTATVLITQSNDNINRGTRISSSAE